MERSLLTLVSPARLGGSAWLRLMMRSVDRMVTIIVDSLVDKMVTIIVDSLGRY